ncbi:hypothetical protein SAMN05428989_3224 [Pseudoxanthomonas sp. GM95]|uniref:YbhB/YbcL family Raf kinase inhibitor-like protein n=1 Tax=Pseudoxanthomonas sp. GM95 TaxID=1881043 RepID=UPI0008D4FB56|nr:YbhB/YbcL family Raf kinase inhibitor-like protein [Pseudoxanthomonas sp. GM95]SEM15671.1 hypothetical protein SAMN05428989_3224 [Pseudoxanthomonas sp. GM95]
MRIHSDSFANGAPIPVAFAGGDAQGFAPNRNPQLAWREVPDGTHSFALLCVDPDVPTVAETTNRDDMEVPVDQPRADFFHWVMIDLPADLRELAEGSCSDGFVAKGKRDPAGPAGARQGLNDYTGYFAGHADLGGEYFGYDGPYPPYNDLRLHHYHFRLYALNVATLPLEAGFNGQDVQAAIEGHVLAQAEWIGTYSLNAKVLAG